MKKQKKVRRKLLNIIKHPSDILRASNETVKNPSDYLDLVQDMIYTVRAVSGVGIAAPQVGVNLKIAVAMIDKKPLVIFNPEILDGSPDGSPFKEGCLSVPGKFVCLGRPNWVEIKYKDLKNRDHIRRFDNFNCVIICHEIDHLNGLLIIDHEEIWEE